MRLQHCITYILMFCTLIFIHEWLDLQFKVDSERQIFEKLFMGNLFTIRVFPEFCWEEVDEEIGSNNGALNFKISTGLHETQRAGFFEVANFVSTSQWFSRNNVRLLDVSNPKSDSNRKFEKYFFGVF